MPPRTCREEFDQAQADRRAFPLPSGAYKLREARDLCLQFHGTIQHISRYENGVVKFEREHDLGNCLFEERGRWLNAIPRAIAWLLGYHIIPGIRALGGDDVSPQDVQRLAQRAEIQVNRILLNCEAVRLTIKSSVRHEYHAMRTGRSTLIPILEDTIQLCDRGLVPVPEHHAGM
jgi:hypothetical protein